MKRFSVTCAVLAAFLLAEHVQSEPVDAPRARTLASAWLNRTAVQDSTKTLAALSPSVPCEPEPLLDGSGRPLAYVVRLGERGFVVVAADTAIEPILFFSTDTPVGCLADPRHPLRRLLRADVPGRLAAAQANPKAFAHGRNLWTRLSADTPNCKTSDGAAALSVPEQFVSIFQPPLLDNHWNQSGSFTDDSGTTRYTYNSRTPRNYLAGCVAVSSAQIARWFQYPERASGYGDVDYDEVCEEWQYDFRFNYHLMPDELTASTPQNQIDEVARLLLACGISVNMTYGATGSNAFMMNAEDLFVDTFGYLSAEGYYCIIRDSNGVAARMETDLASGFPVILQVRDDPIYEINFYGGHALVADGLGSYEGSTLFHLNFGWGRSTSDGWYTLPPASAGFTSFEGAIVNIRPPERRGVDLTCKPVGASLEQGDSVHEAPGAVVQQRCRSDASPNSAARYHLTPRNDGTYPDYFRFTCPSVPSGWVVWFKNADGEDITTQIMGGGFVTTLIRPTQVEPAVYVGLVPYQATPLGSEATVQIVCRSDSDNSRVDAFNLIAKHVATRPDVLIRLNGSGLPYADSAETMDLANNQTARYDVLVVNAGLQPERFTIDAWAQYAFSAQDNPLSETPPGWSVTWYDAQGRDITALLRGAWWRTDPLAAGATQLFSVVVSPSVSVRSREMIRLNFRAVSADAVTVDSATATARKLSYRPALFVGRDADTMEIPVPNLQAVQQVPATYYVRLSNQGAATDAIKLRVSITEPVDPSEWTLTVEHFHPSLFTEDITPAAAGTTGWLASPAIQSGFDRLLRVTVTPDAGVATGTRCLVSLSATSAGDTQQVDAVELDVRCGTPGVQVSAKRDIDTDFYQDFIMYSRLATFQMEHYLVQIRNTGGLPESYVLRAAETADPAWVAYYYDGTNTSSGLIREQIVSPGGWNTGEIAGGETREIRVTVQPGAANLPNGLDFLSTLTATAQGNSSVTDSVTLSVSRALYNLEARIRSQADSAFRQGSTSGRCGVTPAVFNVQFRNTGEAEDSYLLRGSCWAQAGETNWSVRYFNGNTDEEITAAVTNAGWVTMSLPPDVAQDIRIEAMADASLSAGSFARVTLLADSSRCTSITGGVTAVIEKAAYRPRVRVAPDGAGSQLLADSCTQTSGIQTVRFRFEITNDGDDDFFDLFAETYNTSGGDWSRRFLGPEGDDLTESLTNGMRVVMPAGGRLLVTAEMTASNNVPGAATCAMSLTASSFYDPLWRDTAFAYGVRAVPGVDVRVWDGTAYGEQSVDVDALPGLPGVYSWSVVNTGEVEDYFVLHAWYNADPPAEWTVCHYLNGRDGPEVSSELGLDGLLVGPLAPGEACYLRSEAWPPSNAVEGATAQIHLRACSATAGAQDTLSASNVVRRTPAMELTVRLAESLAYTNLAAARVSDGETAAFYIRVNNSGIAADAFTVGITKQTTNTLDWSVRWFDGASDVSDAVRAGSYVMGPLAGGADGYLRLEVAPLSTNTWLSPMLLTLKAASCGDGAVGGTVRANTTARLPIVISRIGLQGNVSEIAVSWQSEQGVTYALQGTGSLLEPFTNILRGVVAPGLSCTVTTAPPASAQGFLRVIEETD